MDNASLLEIVIVGLVLCADSFSAALAMGARPHRFRDTLKFALSSGGAEAAVAYLGAIAGAKIIAEFDSIDHWVSFFLLTIVAIHMAYEGYLKLCGKIEENDAQKFHGTLKIILVSFATSLDALAVGVGLGVSGKSLMPYIISIGLWAFFSTILGMGIAKKASKKMGPAFSIIGALILFLLAVNFLLKGL